MFNLTLGSSVAQVNYTARGIGIHRPSTQIILLTNGLTAQHWLGIVQVTQQVY